MCYYCDDSTGAELPALLQPSVTTPQRNIRSDHTEESRVQTTTTTGMAGDYRVLADQIRTAGLLRRRPASYIARMALTFAAFLAAWAALFVVGNSWASLAVTAPLAFCFTQIAFLGHDAGHKQIFESPRANRVTGLVAGNLLTG